MAQRQHEPRRGRRNRPAARQDWSDILASGALDLLELIPLVGHMVQKWRITPTERCLAEIAEGIEELLDRADLLEDIRTLLQDSISSQSELFDSLRSSMEGYQRPDLLGQLTAYSILAAAVQQIKRLADQAEHMAGSLKGIDENIRSVNVRGDYFPTHVHSYARMMIENHASAPVPHYFVVFNKSSQWHPKFADLQRNGPLGPSYLGHKTDLDELCAFLAGEVRPRVGPKAVLHILMPTIGQLSLEEAVSIPEAMHPCFIDGQLGDAGAPFVFICMPNTVDKECLRDIGVLKPRQVWAMNSAVGIPLIAYYQFETRFFIDPSYKLQTEVSLLVAAGFFYCCGPEPPRTLGQRVARPWY